MLRPLTHIELQRVALALCGDEVGDRDDEYVNFLETPEELHQFAISYNWDNSIATVWSVIRNPVCDRGTALLFYWYAGPRAFYQYKIRDEVSIYELEVYDLIKEIEEKYIAGFYINQSIRFDPTGDQGIDWTSEYSDLEAKQQIPSIMLIPSPGDSPSPDYYNYMPDDYID